MEADVFSREPNGLIALRITQDEWDELLIVFRYAIGSSDDALIRRGILRLANRLNMGNPNFIPYEVPAAARS